MFMKTMPFVGGVQLSNWIESPWSARVFCRQCIVGYLLDRRCFSVRRMQSILESAWRLRRRNQNSEQARQFLYNTL